MKKILSLVLSAVLVLTMISSGVFAESVLPETARLNDPDILPYLEDTLYESLTNQLDEEKYVIENIQTVYISREYLDELEYNSQANIFFGYTLEELDAQFQGTRYVFTLGEDGKTVVETFTNYDDSYKRMLHNVAIGTGVILVCITVSVVSAGAGVPAVSMVFAMSAKGSAIGALSGSAIGGVSAGIVKGLQTNDMDAALKAGEMAGSEGFKWGAISGSISGLAKGISLVGDTAFFDPGTSQYKKYPEGVRFTKNGTESYPRFEKWAKQTVKFDSLPTPEVASNHTGLSGVYYWDAKLANQMCGLKTTPSGYVWHHVEDMKSMLLIPQDLHSVVFGGLPHKGGSSLIREFLNNV